MKLKRGNRCECRFDFRNSLQVTKVNGSFKYIHGLFVDC